MDAHYPARNEPATPEYVLAVFQDIHRQMCACGDADPDTSIEFETTVEDWMLACDVGDLSFGFDWRSTGRQLNAMWETSCTDAEWKAVLKRPKKKRLAGVCELIAKQARRPRIRPATMFGCDGKSAGAFLTVRALLSDAGASAERITPSTPLAEFLRPYRHVFVDPIRRLAPGALPPVRIRTPIHNAIGWFSGVMFLGIAFGQWMQFPWVIIVCIVLFFASWIGTAIAATWIPPASVTFGELRTFRDLAMRLAPHGE